MVELIAQWSNLRWHKATLRRAAKPTARRAEVDPEPPSPRIHKLDQRLDSEILTQILNAYRAGESANSIAERFNIARNSVNSLAADAGLARRVTRLTPEDKQRVAALYVSGLSLVAVGEQFGCSPATIRNALIDIGIARRDPH